MQNLRPLRAKEKREKRCLYSAEVKPPDINTSTLLRNRRKYMAPVSDRPTMAVLRHSLGHGHWVGS